MSSQLRRSLWFGLLASALLLLGVATFDDSGPQTAEERIQQLSEGYACPTCQGQSVAESNAAVAVTIRQFIANEVRAGATDVEIRDQLIVAYGGDILLTPPAEGVSSLIWILPVVVLVGSCAALGVVLARRESAGRDVTEADEELVAKARAELS